MLFNTVTYLLFLPIVFACYWSVRTQERQNWVLLLASMVFYGWWSVPCLGLMVGTCLLNYLFVCMMQKGKHRKMWLTLSLLLNFGILATFKYCNFFAGNLALMLNTVGLKADFPTLNIILPVGISFYTFQLSAYVIDCYKGVLQPTRSLLRFLTFISFFPQLVAGPIERGHHLLPQFSSQRSFNEIQATEGMRLILWGLVKKMLIADNCAPQVDYVFSHYDTVSLPTLWLGALYFTFQIYGDFSGYSDMAVGSAKLFGINITRNFNCPYFASSMQDFWRRWHITLMGWFKDYVYIPLGGNRRGNLRKHFNNLCVFLLSGLWHGANWTFVCWGLYHALVYRLPVRRFAFLLVLIGWVIFRAPDMYIAIQYLGGMFNPTLLAAPSCSKMPLALIALLMLTEWRMKEAPHPFQWKPAGWQSSQLIRFTLYIIIFIVTVVYGGEKTQFIYFQF
ncbi:MAG: MBOAT family protein [Bacteroidaceae bacterium]|nr:MBOAT family protein [Bacteroidaceae bacterium]